MWSADSMASVGGSGLQMPPTLLESTRGSVATLQNVSGKPAQLQQQPKQRPGRCMQPAPLDEPKEPPANCDPSVRVRNTFIDSALSRSPSFEDFFKERDVLSCPSNRIGRLTGLFREYDETLNAAQEVAVAGSTKRVSPPRSMASTPLSTPLVTPSHCRQAPGLSITTSSRGASPLRQSDALDPSLGAQMAGLSSVPDTPLGALWGGLSSVPVTPSGAPWSGLSSVPATPYDQSNFSLAGSLQDHVRMYEEFSQAQRAATQLAPMVHQLAPAVSSGSSPPPAPPSGTFKHVLSLDSAIEGPSVTKVTADQPLPSYQQAMNPPAPAPAPLAPPPGSYPGFNCAPGVYPPSGLSAPNNGYSVSHLGGLPGAAPTNPELSPSVCSYVHSAQVGHAPDGHATVFQQQGAHLYPVPAMTGPPPPPLHQAPIAIDEVPRDRRLMVQGHPATRAPFCEPTLGDRRGSACVAPGTAELPSMGSAGHASGKCKPCAFMHNKGCENGAMCQFCHLCEPGEKKRRHKEKLTNRRKLKQALLAPPGAPPN